GNVRMVRTRSQRICHAVEGRLAIKIAEVRERIFDLLGYDAELPMRACPLERLDTRSRELKYARYFYESFFRIFMRDSKERERYKASNMESRKDASVLESRTVHTRSNKCQPHERKRINSSSSSPNNHFITKNLESTQRERQNIRVINQELSEGNKWLKSAKGSGSRRWEYSSVMRGKLDSTTDSYPDTEGVKSTVERKESFVDEVAEEEIELELVLGELGQSRKKRFESSSAQPNLTTSKIAQKFMKRQIKKALPSSGTIVSGEVAQGKRRRVEPLGNSREKVFEERSASIDDLKEVDERARLVILQGKEDTSQMSKLKKAKSELEKNLARVKTEALKEVRQLKAAHAVAIGQLQDEAKANLDEAAEERDRLEDEKVEVLGVVDGLDGVSPQTVLDNQGDDVELPEGGYEKLVRGMSLQINDLESGLARERETSKALLSARVELQDELDASRAREDHALMCNREFTEQFDRIKEANENREDQYVKAYFRLEKLNQAISYLTRQVKEKDYGIKKGLEDLSEAAERARNLQRQVNALAAKGRQADMAQYRIQALVARENLSAPEATVEHFQIALPAKDMEFREIQRRCDDLNVRVARLKTKRDQAIARAKNAEARECSGGCRTVVKAPLDQGDAVNLSSRIGELESDVSLIWEVKGKELLDNCAKLKVCYGRLKARFTIVIIPVVSQSDLLRVIVAFFVEEVKKLESERDTVLKTLSYKGCTCGAKIDQGNCLGAIETQLGPQTAKSIARGKVSMAGELNDRPLDDVGESIADTPSAENNLLLCNFDLKTNRIFADTLL
ncbi:hypothetical protein GIB67_030815, partial [Kingdonia uniflora]